MMIAVISQPPARLVMSVTSHSRSSDHGELALVMTAATGTRVLGEQLTAGPGEGDEADREGQPAEHLAAGGVLDQKQRQDTDPDVEAAEQAGGGQAGPGVAEPLPDIERLPASTDSHPPRRSRRWLCRVRGEGLDGGEGAGVRRRRSAGVPSDTAVSRGTLRWSC
jgi:hypothetical protein